GNQPPYYYVLVQIPIYEFLPAFGALGAMIYGLIRWIRAEDVPAESSVVPSGDVEALSGDENVAPPDNFGAPDNVAAPDGREASSGRDAVRREGFPAIPFLAFWSVAGVVAFSIAGEKMPWLTTHITLPFILLSGWFFGTMIDKTDWTAVRERGGWIAAALLPVFVVASVSALLLLLGTTPPFQGKELSQLQTTFGFLSALLVAGIAAVGLVLVGRRSGWRPLAQVAGLSVVALLTLLTARVAIIASFVRYDEATEYLVYAHGAPAVKTVMAQIEDISRRTSDGLDLRVAYDDDVSWPMTWYFRNYANQVFYGAQPTREGLDVPVVVAGDSNWAKVEPLLGNRYYSYEYIRMWWPMQEYFNLDGTRIKDALTKPEWREALWNIWWARDYTKYGQLTATDYSLSRWPVADRMKLYIRKDIAAQIWNYGVGPTQLGEAVPEDPFKNLKQVHAADVVFGSAGQGQGQFSFPRALAVAPDGSLYVADTRNHRVQKFDANGKLQLAWGSFGDIAQNTAAPGTFNEPWGIAVDSKGDVFVSDTWNHRVQKFDANGNVLTTWGTFGTGEGNNFAMWGPRGLAVDSQDRVYVADTGNKRILVFDADGNALGQVGSPGSLDGQFDEPVGVAVAADGRIFVADTWNQRVQVFKPDHSYLAQWPINGWFGQSLDNKPYLAVDGKGRVYVTDPEGYRVLVFTEDGKPVEAWGDFGQDAQTLGLPAGITLDAPGNIWVADANNNRVMRFAALP
ncbi:MAG: SMP-30/gluconolactonase/LRE family protein, partial [Chloroflexi bacterium]|nr:SMP-30/gluconolactonase/LRE family protein [Chloroflexota bacterium]